MLSRQTMSLLAITVFLFCSLLLSIPCTNADSLNATAWNNAGQQLFALVLANGWGVLRMAYWYRTTNLTMNHSIDVAVAFLGGTILSVDGGYRVLQHPKKQHIFSRIADARWFLAVYWCDQHPTPADILTHDGQVTFQNHAALAVGDTLFLPLQYRKDIFQRCLTLTPGHLDTYIIQNGEHHSDSQLDIMGLDIDPRYGRVALVNNHYSDALAPFWK